MMQSLSQPTTKYDSVSWLINGVDETEVASDQDILTAGRQTSFTTHSEFDVRWETASLSFDYSSATADTYIILDPWFILLDRINGQLNLSRFIGGSACAAWDIDLRSLEWASLEIVAELNSIVITINGQRFSYQAHDEVPMTFLQIHFSEGATFTEPQLKVKERISQSVPLPTRPKALEMTVDFWDDLQLTAFNQEMLDEMFQIMASYGTSQAHWIHHGKRGMGGIWENNVASEYMQRTFDMLGDDYLPAAVKAAHKSNISLVGVFKPFETTMCNYTNPLREGEGVHDALGGKLDDVFAYPVAHPKICQRRRNPFAPQAKPAQIVIASRKALASALPDDIEIYVSRDNATYTPYVGPLETVIGQNEIRLTNLEIEAEFVVLSFAPELATEIQNPLPPLVHVFDEEGQHLDFTYGITPRLLRKAEYHLDQTPELLDFREHGTNFDCASDGMPSCNCNPEKFKFDLFSPGQRHNFIGLAFNANAQAPSIPSEAEPGAQQWWLSILEEMLDANADAVEIRMMNHSNVIDWQQYGFNQPVIDEYQRRYGIDITREEFSRAKFREIRGEFFTDFLRKASALVRGRGKKFRLHIEDMRQGSANEPCPMEIEMQWRVWLAEDLCDGVTLKSNNFWSHDTAFGRELLAICHAKFIPVSFAPFIHSPFMNDHPERTLDYSMSSAFDAFNIYEFASLFAFAADGKVSIIDEKITEWLKSYPWRQN